MCMQNSAGKRMLLLSEKATETIEHFSYGNLGTSAVMSFDTLFVIDDCCSSSTDPKL